MRIGGESRVENGEGSFLYLSNSWTGKHQERDDLSFWRGWVWLLKEGGSVEMMTAAAGEQVSVVGRANKREEVRGGEERRREAKGERVVR